MQGVGERERVTQNRVVALFREKLDYTCLGRLHGRDNSNIDAELLREYLAAQSYTAGEIRRAVNALREAARKPHLYDANKAVYRLLRYGASVKEHVSEHHRTVRFINWDQPLRNNFYIAEEVTVRGAHTKRPDIVLYVNGIALAVLELKRSTVTVSEGIRQNLDNQQDEFIRPFFATVQLVMAGNDTEGLRYGVINTPEKYFTEWKEDPKATDALSQRIKMLCAYDDYKLDRHLTSLCEKERLLDIVHNFMVFDAGTKKICRHNQYFGVLAARERVRAREGGIIWHTQGSGKSLTMVWLSRWIKENIPESRILIVTDREELDDQIAHKVFGADGVGDEIYRTESGADLIATLNATTPRVMCSLVHKFGRHGGDDQAFDNYIQRLLAALPAGFKPKGDFYVFVDECHRTQSGKLHHAMSTILPDAVFIGFTGTPLLSRREMKRRGLRSSIEVFGAYIHTYKYPEAVADGVILDLRYEARDVPQEVTAQDKIDRWFEAKTRGLTETARVRLKKRWGTLKEVYSSETRLAKIAADIILDMETKDRLASGRGNAMLVAYSIYEACKYYKLFTDRGFTKCAIVTSYTADIAEIKGEATGESRDTENRFKYEVYQQMLQGRDVQAFEKEVKERFVKEPARMKLLIVVDKLLTGFDAPSATYLYIDKSMRDHGLFQAICRVNRLDGEDKEYGYIIDYMDLFKSLERAVADYTSGAFDGFEPADVTGLLKNRVREAKKRLEDLLEDLRALCEPVKMPRQTLQFISYFCGGSAGEADELAENEPKRRTLYQLTASLVRAFADVAGEPEEAGYTAAKLAETKKEVAFYQRVRDEIKLASGDYIDLKKYEADMRHLIDNYISAGESEQLSAFDDLTLIELIVQRGTDFTEALPEGIRRDPEAAAEVIENNVRRRIIEKRSTNPLYYEKMSALLMKIIEERKREKADYKRYLEQITALAGRIERPEAYTDYPDGIRESPAMRALYDNVSKDKELVLGLHRAIISGRPDKWLGDKVKERVVQRVIYEATGDEGAVDQIFAIVKEQREYYDT